MATKATNIPSSKPDEGDGDPLWQQDFPINREEELNNSRRQFLKFLGLTSLAFFTGTLGVALKAVYEQGRTGAISDSRPWARPRSAIASSAAALSPPP